MHGADAQVHPHPVPEKFLDPSPRPAKPQVQRYDQRRQARPHQAPFAELDPGQLRVDLTLTRDRAGGVPTGTDTLSLAVFDHP
jgi:hypothetical protein